MSHHECHVRQTQTSSSADFTLHSSSDGKKGSSWTSGLYSLLLKRAQSVLLLSVLPSCLLPFSPPLIFSMQLWADVPCFLVVDDAAGFKVLDTLGNNPQSYLLLIKSPLSPFFTKRVSNKHPTMFTVKSYPLSCCSHLVWVMFLFVDLV